MAKASDRAPSRGMKSEAELRADRRAEALRANLRRRKAQARGRVEETIEEAAAGTVEATGTGPKDRSANSGTGDDS